MQSRVKHHHEDHHCECQKSTCHNCFNNMGHSHHTQCEGFFVNGSCNIPTTFPNQHSCYNDLFHLKLAGLDGNLHFVLFSKKGCCADVHIECAGNKETITGRVCDVGTDFITVVKDDQTTVTILKERICTIFWKDSCCKHCVLPPCENDNAEVID